MDDWDNFYILAGGTAGTLIGLIFVVVTLGIDHAKKGDDLRARLFVTPIIVYFTSLLVIAMVIVPPMSAMVRAVSLGVIGCAGLAYVLNLIMISRGGVLSRGEGNQRAEAPLLPAIDASLLCADRGGCMPHGRSKHRSPTPSPPLPW